MSNVRRGVSRNGTVLTQGRSNTTDFPFLSQKYQYQTGFLLYKSHQSVSSY